MGSPENLSKRERQRQRRDAKLQEQAILDKKARRNRLLTFAVVGLVLLGLIGLAVANNIAARNRRSAEVREVAARLDELGCTPDEEQEAVPANHLDTNEQLAAAPPETLYPSRPASSGGHYAQWLKTGVYDQDIDERALVHNMEHGYVVGYYDDGADEEQVAAFKEYAQDRIDEDLPKIIVAPWDGELEGDANFAWAAWGRRQMCAEYDDGVFKLFAEAHHSGNGAAPEKGVAPHLAAGNGTNDPGDEPFLLPPLGAAATPAEGTNDVPAEGGTTESSS